MKTINIKIVFAFFFLLNISLQAQFVSTKKWMCDELMRNSYIFEGKVISQHPFKIMEDKYKSKNYTSYLIEVKKVVKGNINKGTVTIIMPQAMSSDGHVALPPDEGLYFCDYDMPKDTTISNTNSKSLGFYCGDSMSNGELKKDSSNGLLDYFPTISEFYVYISTNYGVKIEQ